MRSISLRIFAPLFATALLACGQGRLVQVPERNAGARSPDAPDAGPLSLVPEEKSDAGSVHVDGGEREPTTGGTTGGGSTGGAGTSGGSTGGATTGGVSGGTTGGSTGTSGSATTGGVPVPMPDAGPSCGNDPDLAGDWTLDSHYDLSQGVANGLPGMLQAFTDIDNFLNTLATFGAPVPQWALTLFNDLANLDALFQDIHVVADLQLGSTSAPLAYSAQETWNSVTVMQNGTPVPLNAGNASFTSPGAYGVTTCNGTATFDSHSLGSALSGLVPPILDAVTNLATCSGNGPCYSSFDQAVQGALDCSQYSGTTQAFCNASSAALLTELQNALAQVAVGFDVADVQGTAHIADVNDLVNGVWVGNVQGTPFPGTFFATRN